MRIFAVSDLHLDYEPNARWLAGLSRRDYTADVLLLAGDLSDSLDRIEWALELLARRFRKVAFVPGNHDLWVIRDRSRDSPAKLQSIRAVARQLGVSIEPCHFGSVSIVPLLGWYDYSFGTPSPKLRAMWMDFKACRWPQGEDMAAVTRSFTDGNEAHLTVRNATVISFSHFLPRMDLLPRTIPHETRALYPVLGSTSIERQIRRLGSTLHIYGHSHLNREVTIDGVSYINNAYGYPSEVRITSRQLRCVHES